RRQAPHPAGSHYIQLVARPGGNRRMPGEFTKGRQHPHLRSEIETRQAKRVASPALQAAGGMNMSCQDIAAFMLQRMVAHGKRSDQTGFVFDTERQRRWRISSMAVVIAANQYALERGMARTPVMQGSQHGRRDPG